MRNESLFNGCREHFEIRFTLLVLTIPTIKCGCFKQIWRTDLYVQRHKDQTIRNVSVNPQSTGALETLEKYLIVDNRKYFIAAISLSSRIFVLNLLYIKFGMTMKLLSDNSFRDEEACTDVPVGVKNAYIVG